MLSVWTIGHSNRPLAAFLDLLARHSIQAVADVRRFPASQRHPHFAGASLAAALAGRGMAYRHFPDLGGWRKPLPGSPNTGWRTSGFQGYADHMATPAFAAALNQLLALVEACRVAILCAEASPYHCHRQLIADALFTRGVHVLHILDHGAEPHRLTPFAQVVGDRLIYPPPGGHQQALEL